MTELLGCVLGERLSISHGDHATTVLVPFQATCMLCLILTLTTTTLTRTYTIVAIFKLLQRKIETAGTRSPTEVLRGGPANLLRALAHAPKAEAIVKEL